MGFKKTTESETTFPSEDLPFLLLSTYLYYISLFILHKFIYLVVSGGRKKKTESQSIIYACLNILKLIKMAKIFLQVKAFNSTKIYFKAITLLYCVSVVRMTLCLNFMILK